MSKIKCIIFDVGGVLIGGHYIDSCKEVNKMLGKQVMPLRYPKKFDTIKNTEPECMFRKKLASKVEMSRQNLERIFYKTYCDTRPLNTEVLRIAYSLRKKGYKTAIVSNVSPFHKKINKKRGTYQGFHPVILSCDISCKKPQKKIFEIFLRKTKLMPETCIFIDDKTKYLITPQKLGMKTILYKNPSQLKRDLKKLGVKI